MLLLAHLPTPLLNSPHNSVTLQAMLSTTGAQESLQVQKAWTPTCLKDVGLSWETSSSTFSSWASSRWLRHKAFTVTTTHLLHQHHLPWRHRRDQFWITSDQWWDPLPAYQPHTGAQSSTPLHKAYRHPDKAGSTLLVQSFDFSSSLLTSDLASSGESSLRGIVVETAAWRFLKTMNTIALDSQTGVSSLETAIFWDFHLQQSPGFTEKGQSKATRGTLKRGYSSRRLTWSE